MKKVIIAYIPVIHNGYINFLRSDHEVESLYLIGTELIGELGGGYLKKEIRALTPSQVAAAIKGLGLFEPKNVFILDPHSLAEIRKYDYTFIMPDEDVCRELADRYLLGCSVKFSPVFLRWDRKNSVVNKDISHIKKIPYSGFVAEMLDRAFQESQKSSDWWRQIGAVIAKGGEMFLAGWNTHVPSPFEPYYSGDPRNCFKRGINIDISTVLHAEARLISEAASWGISTKGADIFITAFPCPFCAYLIGNAKFRTCYFSSGYAVLDGEKVLRENGVELVFVEQPDETKK
ncbi:MAG: deaminase [Patescibacteria group bacterium]